MTKCLSVGGTSLLPASGAGSSSCGHAESDTRGTALSVSDTDNRSVVEMKASGALQVTSAAEYMTYRYGWLVFPQHALIHVGFVVPSDEKTSISKVDASAAH